MRDLGVFNTAGALMDNGASAEIRAKARELAGMYQP